MLRYIKNGTENSECKGLVDSSGQCCVSLISIMSMKAEFNHWSLCEYALKSMYMNIICSKLKNFILGKHPFPK